jgi:hypothetical protein
VNIKLTIEQVQWLVFMTDTRSAQEAVDVLSQIMTEEGANPKDLIHYVKRMMLKQLPPGKG